MCECGVLISWIKVREGESDVRPDACAEVLYRADNPEVPLLVGSGDAVGDRGNLMR